MLSSIRLISNQPPGYYVGMVSCAIVFSALAAFATVMFLRSLNGIVHTSAADINTLWEAVGLLMGLVICSYLAQILIFKSAFEYVGAVRMNLVSIVADAPLEHIETFGVEEIYYHIDSAYTRSVQVFWLSSPSVDMRPNQQKVLRDKLPTMNNTLEFYSDS